MKGTVRALGSGVRLEGGRAGLCTEAERAGSRDWITPCLGDPWKEFGFYFKCEEFPGGFQEESDMFGLTL